MKGLVEKEGDRYIFYTEGGVEFGRIDSCLVSVPFNDLEILRELLILAPSALDMKLGIYCFHPYPKWIPERYYKTETG